MGRFYYAIIFIVIMNFFEHCLGLTKYITL